jgi:pimeloyl-ACP methyl ester carboxylesterase
MWRKVAPLLAERHTVVCADLRGYGDSGCPPSSSDHAPYAKRAMARDMISGMTQLGLSGSPQHLRGKRCVGYFFFFFILESTGLFWPRPVAERRLGRLGLRTVLTFPLFPPPQKN